MVLHGRLRRKFGAEYQLGVSSPAAALAALVLLVPGFRAAIEEGEYRVRRGTFKKGVDLSDAALRIRIVPSGEMHIIPVARGGKRGGGGKVILGTVMVIAAVALMQPELLAVTAGAEFGGAAGLAATVSLGFSAPLIGSFTIGNLALAGGAMILGGIIQMISPQPKSQTAQTTNSYLMSGLGNTTQQGAPVPLVYGKTRTGSVVVSAGYTAEDYTPNNALMQPAVVGNGFEPTTTGGTTPAGDPTEAIGTSGPVNDGQGPQTESGETGSGGGGGKGGGGGGREDPDTLRSKATVRIIDVLGEGPIGGLVDGAKSIFFNGTPLQANDGSYNFKGVTWEIRYGTPDQAPVPGFPASESSTSVGTKVAYSNPVTRTITGSSINAARVTIQIPALFRRDPNKGDVTGTDLQYRVEVRPSKSGGGGWVGDYEVAASVNLIGAKCVSPYERSHRFTLPRIGDGANTWDIRVIRVTANSGDLNNLQNDVWFQYLDEIVDHRMIYPNTAYIALTIDGKVFGGSVPSRQYEIYGRTISVPLNYDPATRIYATSGAGTSGGTWDLSSVHALPSDNPAWVLYDMLSHPRYGSARKATHLEAMRAKLYQIAQYADGMVPNGFGGTEPRYAVNVTIPQQDDAYRTIQMMVSSFRGMSYWGAGQIMVTADMPSEPVKLVNQTSVVGGDFAYESTSLATRPNLIRVAYLDRNNNYEPAYEVITDALDIAKRGAVPSDIVAWGCTSRGLAHRLGRWAIYLAQRQTETVSYEAPIAQADTRPGDIVKLLDPGYAGLRMGGRIRPSTVSTGENLIANSISPTLTPTAPNTVAGSTAVAAKFHAVTRHVHRFGNGGSPNCGALSVSVLGQTYVGSCYVWVPAAFTGTAVSLAANVDVDPFPSVVTDEYGSPIGLPLTSGLIVGGDLPNSNVANLALRDQWQRIAFVVTFDGAGTLSPELRVTGGSAQTVYSTAWQVEEDVLTYFVTTSSGARVVRELHIDALFVPTEGHTYTVSVVMPNGTIDDEVPVDAIVSDGGTPERSIIKLGQALAGIPYRQAEWVLTSSAVEPRLFQVLGTGELERHRFSVAAVNHDPNRYAEIELGLKFTPPNYSLLPDLILAPLPPPTAVAVRDYVTGTGVTQVIRVTVSWTAPLDPRIVGYQVMGTATDFFQIWDVSNVTSWDIDTIKGGGDYTFGVRSVGRGEQTSAWALIAEAVTVDGKVDPPGAPTGLAATGGTRRVQLRWSAVANRRDILQYEIWRSSSAGSPPGSGATKIGVSGGTSFQDQDSATLTPNTTWYYWVRGMALAGDLVAGAYAGPASATTTLLIADDLADAIIGVAKFASTIKPVLLIASTGAAGTEGAIAFNTANDKLYQYRSGVWVEYINLSEITGQVSDAQIAGLAASKITGQLTNAQLAEIAAAKVSGQLTDAQLAAIAATKITGQLTDLQLAAIAATKITGQIVGTQITDGAVSTAKILAGAVVTAKLAAGAVTADTIAANAITTAKILAGAVVTASLAASAVTADTIATNAITAVKISAGAIETAKIAAVAITAEKIAADAITAAKISAGAVETAKIAAGAIEADKIAAGAVTTGKLAALAIEADKIAANAVTFGKIAAGAVRATEIAAEAISATHLAATFILASNAQFGNAVIRNAQIDALAVGTSNIATQSVTQTYEDFMNTSTTPTGTWTTVADVTVSVATYDKVLLLVRVLSDGMVSGAAQGDTGLGSEGSGGGSGM